MPESAHSRSSWKALEEEEKSERDSTPRDAPSTELKIRKGGGCGDDVKLPLGKQSHDFEDSHDFANTGACVRSQLLTSHGYSI